MLKELDTIIGSNIQSAVIEIKEPTKPKTQKKPKLPNSCYSVKFNGVEFNGSKMSENYANAIKTIIQNDNSIIPMVKNILREFTKTNINDFNESIRTKSKICKIADNLFLSTNSNTDIKKTHLEKISKAINIPIILEKIK
jgi:hypothetical protein